MMGRRKAAGRPRRYTRERAGFDLSVPVKFER